MREEWAPMTARTSTSCAAGDHYLSVRSEGVRELSRMPIRSDRTGPVPLEVADDLEDEPE